ncbi:hypothetical protein [Pseudomonas gingeri]|uniref:hypothetical protein n=1 Tax=Pseudomonas gingeri TaxID=117681 RepID=UPI0015A1FFCF|nr:hypothetical protein [Pseudomonas gingeri]NWA02668.1 hypothetical protein [Pseudomonas gingeri]NWA12159.1 hypothetical protein [Pseudomonas gingeri]NWA57435.1 hypothetical protein [Pseudomonas gingeri]NWA93778.1 hypothetical protein [Pseudomonas gingeri]NWB03250.1 hypothetical protein [Pseudomonas gingeri]
MFVCIGATGINLQIVTIPPGAKNNGDEPAVALIARSDPSEQESVLLLPHLDDVHRD